LSSENKGGIWDDGVNYLPRMWSQEAIPDSEGAAFEKKRLRSLQSRSRHTDATVWIGKEGPSEDLVNHVRSQLKAREFVKVKVHKSALEESETGDLAKNIATSTEATLVEVMGHTFSLYKKRETTTVKRKS
jgi:RNA-binding protein